MINVEKVTKYFDDFCALDEFSLKVESGSAYGLLGSNGAGKSTIARSLRDNTGIEWKNGKSASDYDVLTYNTEFIDANFANYGNLAGVFTVCETNIEVQKKIEALQADKSAVAEEYKKKSVAAESKRKEKEGAVGVFQEACWNQSKTLRPTFDAAIKDLMQNRSKKCLR